MKILVLNPFTPMLLISSRAVNIDKYKGRLKIVSGAMKGESLWLDYEDFSKSYEQ